MYYISHQEYKIVYFLEIHQIQQLNFLQIMKDKYKKVQVVLVGVIHILLWYFMILINLFQIKGNYILLLFKLILLKNSS